MQDCGPTNLKVSVMGAPEAPLTFTIPHSVTSQKVQLFLYWYLRWLQWVKGSSRRKRKSLNKAKQRPELRWFKWRGMNQKMGSQRMFGTKCDKTKNNYDLGCHDIIVMNVEGWPNLHVRKST
jgi:hypothetical protein